MLLPNYGYETRYGGPTATRVRARALGLAAGLLVAAFVHTATPAAAGCPSAAKILERIVELQLGRGARTARYEVPPPTKLYDKASRQIGEPCATRDGHKGGGVIIAEVPVASIWKALNDENRHALEGSPIPVDHSEVIGGRPRGEDRVIFQWMKQMGIGRWWVSRVWMNRELYESTDGQLWELLWEDQTADVDPDEPPMNSISSELTPVKRSQGAWLLVPLDEACTLVEYFNWSDPGGVIGWAQPLVIGKAIRQTVGGVVSLAAEYTGSPDSGPRFQLPDGTTLD